MPFLRELKQKWTQPYPAGLLIPPSAPLSVTLSHIANGISHLHAKQEKKSITRKHKLIDTFIRLMPVVAIMDNDTTNINGNREVSNNPFAIRHAAGKT